MRCAPLSLNISTRISKVSISKSILNLFCCRKAGEKRKMKVTIVERVFSTTRDVEGSEYYRITMDADSPEFERFMDDHHVLEKYRNGQRAASYHGHIYGAGRLVGLYTGYFSGWFRDIARERPIWERKYIEIVEPVTYRN